MRPCPASNYAIRDKHFFATAAKETGYSVFLTAGKISRFF
jgi:hypothetical protein